MSSVVMFNPYFCMSLRIDYALDHSNGNKILMLSRCDPIPLNASLCIFHVLQIDGFSDQ